ncbi:12066_t:CDS:2 [Ambispora gerdemannii]|uniref:12066_t:CDS:1 n=1 Tax=Ambispora gerdemannii TaxID=144530 RepID=A0A9N9CBU1_9GLOM|nr:12066_t:CDS:2 [Ambispora gerdemannii]
MEGRKRILTNERFFVLSEQFVAREKNNKPPKDFLNALNLTDPNLELVNICDEIKITNDTALFDTVRSLKNNDDSLGVLALYSSADKKITSSY